VQNKSVNAKVSKLLKSYSRCTGEPLNDVKREWNSTPRNKRGAVRLSMESGIWSNQLRDWRKLHSLQQKEAADALTCPYDTYRSWESMKRTPPRFVQISLTHYMRAYQPKKK
jgi:DNA-binding XRE family transcriptional regulator